ncbi:uncharacterized protein LOC135829349 [Sycon ciliatum]|uniref:uncharacterized protein LOC135829349 n=1 Tax=Sycon ciliatum TaxID=27933 RepID=UPI0031F6E5A2
MASKIGATLTNHRHGKTRVRVARVWRANDGKQEMREWTVEVLIASPMERAFTEGDNSGMTTTDTCKNMCFRVAKQLAEPCGPEVYALSIGENFLKSFPLVTAVQVEVFEVDWQRVASESAVPHNHGFMRVEPARRGAYVLMKRREENRPVVFGAIDGLTVLKTTQSGFEGFRRCDSTALPETRERLLGTSVTAYWRYEQGKRHDFDAAYTRVLAAMKSQFYGPPKSGTYSPSLQFTMYQMGKAAISSYPGLESIELNLPNIHFIPYNMPALGMPFRDDVYMATSEPHGTIQCTVTRDTVAKEPSPVRIAAKL